LNVELAVLCPWATELTSGRDLLAAFDCPVDLRLDDGACRCRVAVDGDLPIIVRGEVRELLCDGRTARDHGEQHHGNRECPYQRSCVFRVHRKMEIEDRSDVVQQILYLRRVGPTGDIAAAEAVYEIVVRIGYLDDVRIKW